MIQKLTKATTRLLAILFAMFATGEAWAATNMTNPVTGATEAYENVFTGGTEGTATEWNSAENWTLKESDKVPFVSGGNYDPALVDGKTVSTETAIDGWTLRVGAYNGAAVTWNGGITKIQAGSAGCWLTADETSSITITSFAGNQLEGSDTYPLKLSSANAGGITWSAGLTSTSSGDGKRIPFWYYLKGSGTVVYGGAITVANVQVIKQADASLSYPAEKIVRRKKLVSFTSSSVRFKTSDSTVVKLGSSAVYFTAGDVPTATTLTTDSPVGACEIVQLPNDTADEEGPGVYLYYVDGKPKAISINFGSNQNGGKASVGAGVEAGLVPVSGWINTSSAGSNSNYPATETALTFTDSVGSTYGSMKLYLCSRGGNYYGKGNTSTTVGAILYGFMDNNNYSPNNDAGIKITGVNSFANRYSVFVYFNKDDPIGSTSAFPPYYINGIPYYGNGSATVPGYQVWGTVKGDTLENGVNALVVHGLTDDTLVIAQPNDAGGRGCIAAMQIVADSESGLEAPIKYVSVIAPSSDWDSLSLPTTARGIDVTTSTIDFGSTTPTEYYQLLGSRQAIVADITSGTITEAATLQTEANNKSCGDVDLYLLVNGGTVTRAIGILNQDWGTSNGSQSGGNAMVQIGGNATVAYAYGAGYEGNGGTAPGSTGVTIKDNATLTGSAFGGWASQHNANPTVSGNTSVKVLNIQKTNTAAADSAISNDAIVGGSGYRSNGYSYATINGSSSVTVDLSGIAAVADTFDKKIIGGCAQLVNNATTSNPWTIGGDSSVTITAGNDITFGQDIVGGSYVVSGRTATMTVTGNSSVTLNGGNYTSRTITAGGSGSGTSSGSATLTINGGIFTSATLAAGNATGAKKLVLNQAINPSATTISGFTELEICDDVTQENISALTGLSATTVGSGAEYTTSAGDEGTVLLKGGTLKLTVSAEQITNGYTPDIDPYSTGGTIRYFDGEGSELTDDVVGNVLLPEGDGSKPYVFELDGDSTYTVTISATYANGIVVRGSGTLTIESQNSSVIETTTVSLEDGANLIVKNSALTASAFTAEANTQTLTIDVTTTFNTPPTFSTVKVQGAGTVVYTGALPPDNVFTVEGWNGTVWIKNYATKLIAFRPNNYGNANSTLRLTGLNGYFERNSAVTHNVAIELVDDGNTAAWTYNDGWGGSVVAFSTLKGSGTLKVTNVGNGETIYFADPSGFTGSFDLAAKKIVLGGNTPTGDNQSWGGKILIPGTVTISSRGTWTAAAGIEVSGSLTVADSITMASAFTVAAGGTLTIANSSTMASAFTVATGGTLTINSGKKLTLNGAYNLNGTVNINGTLYSDDVYRSSEVNGNVTVLGAFDAQGDVDIGSAGSITVSGTGKFWPNYGVVVKGNLSAPSIANISSSTFEGKPNVTVNDTGVFELTSTDNVNDSTTGNYPTSADFSKVTGTGTIKYSSTAGWRAFPDTDAKMPASTVGIKVELADSLIVSKSNGETVIGSLSGSKNIRSDFGTNGANGRTLTVTQSKDTEWQGKFVSNRITQFNVVAPATGNPGTLTLSGTQEATIPMQVDGSVNLTGTWVGATTVAGTFGGTGRLTGSLTFSDGATFKANASTLTVSGTVTLPTGEGETFTIDATGLSAAEVTVLSSSSITAETDVSKVTVNGPYIVTPVAGAIKLVHAVAQISGFSTVYISLQAAVDALAQNNKDIVLLANANGATVSRELTFNVVPGEYTSGDIVAGENYILTTTALEGKTKYSFAPAVIAVTINEVRTLYPMMTANNGIEAANAGPIGTTIEILSGDPASYAAYLPMFDLENGVFTKVTDPVAAVYSGVVQVSVHRTLADAVDAAEAGLTVKLLANVSLDATVAISKTLTLDLNGYAITASGIDAITSSGALTIQGSSDSISVTSGDSVVLTSAAATLTVTGVTLSPTPTTNVAHSRVKTVTADGTTTYSVEEIPGTTFTVY